MRGDVPPALGAAALPDSDEISLLALANVILRYRFWLLVSSLTFAVVVVALGLHRGRTFTTSASFAPQTRRNTAGGVAGIAAQFGFTLPSTDPSQSPQFYVDLLTSDAILRPLVDSVYVFQTDSGLVRSSLVDLKPQPKVSRALRVERAMRELRKEVTASASLKTGVVTFKVTADNPELARQIAARLLDRVNGFNLESRSAQAALERRFTEARLAEVQADLRASEDRLQNFLDENRNYRSSARLSLDQERLERDVQMHQSVATALAQAYEQAKLDELRDTPVITILEQPRAAVIPNSRGLVKAAFLAFFVGALLMMVAILLREYFAEKPEVAPADAATSEFKALVREALLDLRHPVRALARKRRQAVG